PLWVLPEGFSANVKGCVPLVLVRHYGLLREGLHSDDPIGGSHVISNTGTVSELARLEDGQATITYGSGYGPTYPIILGGCDGLSDRGALVEGSPIEHRLHQRDPRDVLPTGDSRTLLISRIRGCREVTTAGVSSLGNQEGLLGEHAGHTRDMVSLEAPYDFRVDIGIVGNLDRVLTLPPSSSGRERVHMVGTGEDQWEMSSMDNNPLYGGVGGSGGVMGRVDVGNDDGAAVKGTPCPIGMAASNTAITTVIPTTSSVCFYMLSIGKAVREGDLPHTSTSVGRGVQETAPLPLEELNDARCQGRIKNSPVTHQDPRDKDEAEKEKDYVSLDGSDKDQKEVAEGDIRRTLETIIKGTPCPVMGRVNIDVERDE
ncbi:hypothetical protein FOZ61_002680, partial [Perkinsus olseni]